MCDCEGGWIFETVDGARLVKDRCMKCNEPLWYAEQRRQRRLTNWWPLKVWGLIIVAEFAVAFAGAAFK